MTLPYRGDRRSFRPSDVVIRNEHKTRVDPDLVTQHDGVSASTFSNIPPGCQRNSLTTAMGCGPVRSGCGFISTLAHPGGDRVAACADRPHRLPNRVADQLAAAHRWHFGQRCTRPDQGNLGAPRAGAARPSPALRCESATRSNVGQTGMFFTDLNESGHAGWSVAGTADPGEDRDLPFVVLFVQYVKAVDRFDD